MLEKIEFIKKHHITNITPLNKGWSKDKKYILTASDESRFLLRISDKKLYDKKKKQFESLKQLENLNIYCSRPLEFGTLTNGDVYTILSYLEGVDGKEAIQSLTNENAYLLGIEAGQALKKLHQITLPKQEYSWWEKYQTKMEKRIKTLLNCEYKIPMQNNIIQYYKDHCFLMKNRPLCFTHGDYHLGNMIVHDKRIGIIDFDRNQIADPYDDFKPFYWNVMESEYFETGLINGYFNNKIPDDFFPILKYYTSESLITHLPWATTFGDEEIRTAQKVADLQMLWYDNFKLEIPTWYKGIITIKKQ